MAGKIPRDFIQDVLARVDLVDRIDARVPLKSSGSNFVARCPFHNEKTPSFNVNRNKQFYYCFGCGARGNAIGFLMEYDRLSFVEAVETLAESVGLPVPREPSRGGAAENRRNEPPVDPLFDVQERASRFYHQQFKAHPAAARAVDYLKRRGVSGELAQRYRLGYAPPGWRNLPTELSRQTLESAGLAIARDGHSYDRFRDRIMFPIRDRRGRVVGFGGRVLGDETPKYLNSPETAVFKKHKEVYGLYELLNAVPKPESILVVEGYMDVIALAQSGIPNAVATLGTATSGDHVILLFRYTSELVFCFDGDAAGQKAAWKALEASLPALRDGRSIRFLRLPEGHDPDSLVRAEGVQSFRSRIDAAQPLSDYFFDGLARNLDLRSIEGRATLMSKAKPLIDQLPSGVFRDMVERRLSELGGYAPVETADKSAKLGGTQRNTVAKERGKPSALRMFLALLLQNPQLATTIDKETRSHLARTEKIGALIKKILELLEERPGLASGGILEFFRETPEETFISKLIGWDTLVSPDKIHAVFSDTLASLKGRMEAERLDELIRKATTGLSPEEREELRRLTTK
jgi:DNA primase